ncbi:MAG: BatA domain-containing protein [Bacteroidota bacterium]
MSFLFPTFLWALLAIGIPIIIHLFYFRRFKKVYFTNVRFLREVKEETSSRARLKHLLVLLSRILAVTFLVLAFAQPFIPQKDTEVKRGQQAISLFIDNSFSMSSLSQDVPLLEKAKQKAREIVSAYSIDDEFQILTNDFERRHQRLVSKEDALGLIDEVIIGPSVKELSKVIARQKQALYSGGAENRSLYMISDFQKNITDFDDQTLVDTTFEFNLVPLQSVQKKNLNIDTCWFEAPVQMLNQTNRLLVKVRNLSDEDVDDVRLTLNLDGQVRPLGSLSVKARSAAFDTVNVTILKTGWHEAELSITDFPVQFDDTYNFAFNVKEEVRILVVNQVASNPYLDAIFQDNSYFKVNNVQSGRIDYSSFKDFQLIILNELGSISSGLTSELLQFVRNGGNVLVFPGETSNLASYKSFSAAFNANEFEMFEKKDRTVSYINTEEFIFKDVFENDNANLKLPATTANFKLSGFGSRNEEVIMRYRDGGTFLGKYRRDKGNLFLSTAPLNVDFSNLARSGEIFVPMIYKMALSRGQDTKIAYTIGKDNVLETDNRITSNEMVYKLKGRTGEFIPEQRNIGSKVLLGVDNQINEAGFFELFLEDDQPLSNFAFNFDRKESELDYFTIAELSGFTGANVAVIDASTEDNLTLEIEERKRGVVLWKWCIILALLFLLIEILLLRLWKT